MRTCHVGVVGSSLHGPGGDSHANLSSLNVAGLTVDGHSEGMHACILDL